MNYKFKKEIWGELLVYGVISDITTLQQMTNWDWTPKKTQTIIDGIDSSKTKEKGEEYYWGNENIDIYANKNGILLIDKISQRCGIHDPDIITLRLTHQEMIQFLQDFKTFIEENS